MQQTHSNSESAQREWEDGKKESKESEREKSSDRGKWQELIG